MMDNIRAMNQRLAEHWVGRLTAEQEDYIQHANVCFAQLPYSAEALSRSLARSRRTHARAPQVAALNRQYLHFARLVSKDALAEFPSMLLVLGITIKQAEFLRNLSDEDIEHLVLEWKQPIVRFPLQAFQRGARLHRVARRLHASAFIAVRRRLGRGKPA